MSLVQALSAGLKRIVTAMDEALRSAPRPRQAYGGSVSPVKR
jgi:hypothetical protein